MALRVIGAGLGRTGTLSLKLALEHIGFGPCYHMAEVLAGARRNLPLWTQAVRGSPDWDAIFDGYAATVDYPGCTYWRELAAQYPDAKVILSTRDPESWFRSVHQTIFSPESVVRLADSPAREFTMGAVRAPFGDRIGDAEFMADFIRNWQADVIAGLPPERLLVWTISEGWEPICAFLGVPVPIEPFPRVNSGEDIGLSGMNTGAQPNPLQIEAMAQGFLGAMKAKAFSAE